MHKILAVLCVIGLGALILPIATIYIIEPKGGRVHRLLDELAKE
jgi:hypothetical protein